MTHAQRAQRPAPRFFHFQTLLLALLALVATAARASVTTTTTTPPITTSPTTATTTTAPAAPLATSAPAAPAATELDQQCDTLLAGGKIPEAQALAQKAVAADPKNADAHYNLGLVFIEQDDYADAIQPLEKATALAPGIGKYHRALGDAYGLAALHAGLLNKLAFAKKSKAAYEKAVELDPASTHARESLINYLWQAPAIAGGGKDKAFAQIDALEKINPAAARAQRLKYLIKDKNYPAARAQLAAALAANADDYLALYQTGQVAALSGENLDAGAAALQRTLALAPPAAAPGHAEAHYELGNIAALKGDKPAARVAYQAALALAPSYKEAQAALEKLQ